MDVGKKMSELEVPENRLAICWAGQAGFLFKDSKGRVSVVDLYLSDCGERIKGFKRFSAKILDPALFAPDYYFISHSHFDHLDYDAVPLIAENGKTLFVTTPSCARILKAMDIPGRMICTMGCNDTFRIDDEMQVTSLPADHGGMVPDCYGYIMKIGGHVIYFTADTCYRKDIFMQAAEEKPDIIITCINGRFGNMNEKEAAMAARDTGVSMAIPCHFWTFMEHGGNPESFLGNLEKHAPYVEALLFSQGEIRIV